MDVSLWSRIRRWATPPVLADEEQNRVAALIHYLLLAVIVGASLNIIFVLAEGVQTQRDIFPILIVLVSLLSFALLRRGHVRAVGFLVTGSLWAITTASVTTGAGLRSTSLSFYLLTIVLAAVLLGERSTIVFTAMSILSLVVIAVLDGRGMFLGAQLPTSGNSSTFYVTLYLAVSSVLYVTARSIRANFARVLKSEQALGERNRELEHQIAERERATDALHVSEAKYRLLFEVSLLATVIYEPDGNILMINKNFASDFGGEPQRFVGQYLYDLLSVALCAHVRAETREIVQTGRGSNREVQLSD